MKRQELYKQLRYIFLTGSIICLVFALAFTPNVINSNAQTEDFLEAPKQANHRILFLSSYDPLYFSAESQRKGIDAGLYPNAIEYDVVYMDTKNYETQKDIQTFHDFLKKRLATNKRQYEAILVGDDAALEFAIKFQNDLFASLPIIFFGINNLTLAEQASSLPNITGFYEQNYLEETLQLAMKLYPDVHTFYGMHDQSTAGKADANSFTALAQKYNSYTFQDFNVSKLSQSQIIAALEALPSNAILIYMTSYSDIYGNNYSIRARTETVVGHAHVPIFRNYICAGVPGVIGGTYMDFVVHCTLASHLVAEILDGRDIDTIPLRTETPPCTAINYQLMKDLHLDFSKLPSDTIFYNKPSSFLDYYGAILPPVSLLTLALLFLLAVAHTVSLLSREAENELKKSHDALEASHEELRYKAEYDEGLDILNRHTATEYLRNSFDANAVYSVVIIDIDSFKELNESFGHQVADSILQYMVAILRSMGKDKDWLLARYGGDEFLLVVPNETLDVEHPLIEDLLTQIRSPIPLGDETISITASIGISNSDGITPPEQHISNAENAMYEAKSQGKDGAFLYGEKMKERAREEALIKTALLEAFENNGFYMLYQPQINSQTLEVSGYEALVRMKAPGMYPGKFIPIAERNGWIWKIGRITTELAIQQLAAWKAEGKPLHPVSINYSSNQLNDNGYVDFVLELLARYDIPPCYLEIEITEGLFLEKSSLADQIFKRFKAVGIRLLMDDFGTGYSSLGYLSYLPVDVIKLDKSLVDAYLVNGKEAFIRDVIQMMHDLNKEMIIEGVEEQWQFERLRQFGADTIQGYFFSKPIPADEAINFTAAKIERQEALENA